MSVSRHAVRVFEALRENRGRWRTSDELAAAAGVLPRTARAHLTKLVRLGAVETAPVWPTHYRLAEAMPGEPAEYVRRLEQAAEVFTNHQEEG